MNTATEELISIFHSITGTTVGDRQKHLHLLLRKIPECKHVEIDFSLVEPKTPLEEKLKVDVLIYFKRIPELMNVFKSENPILIERILRMSHWFIELAFKDISGKELTNSIFPYISFSAKAKILHKLALNVKNPEKGDDYFKCVEEKYGFYLASRLIPCCSIDLIMKCMKVNKLKIAPKHLLLVIKKYPFAAEPILKELNNTELGNLPSIYTKVFKHLAKTDVPLFLKLNKEYNMSVQLGWRITDKYIKTNKETVIKSPDDYYRIFHNKQIAKSLNHNFPELYSNMFPTSLNKFTDHYNKLMDMCNDLPNKICNVELLFKTFEKRYGSNLWDHLDYINLTLLNMLSVKNLEVVVKSDRRPDSIKEEKWHSYMKTEISIPYLKKAISLSSNVKTRAELVTLLVETCKHNSDTKTLANMCTYMVTKHRNDHTSVRQEFLKTVNDHFKLEDLEEEHWSPINELIEIFSLNEERFYHASEYIEGYIYYRLKNNMDVKEELRNYMKGTSNSYNIIKEKPEYEKKCLLMFGELLPETYNDEELEDHVAAYLCAIVNWNKMHPNDQISLFNYAGFMDKVQCAYRSGCRYETSPIIEFCIFKINAESEKRKAILKTFFTETNANPDVKIITFLLKTEPLTIKDNIHVLRGLLRKTYSIKPYRMFWNCCRYLTHLDIPQQIITFFTDSYDDEVIHCDDIIKCTIATLSLLMTNEEFLNFIQPYYPRGLRANPKSKEGKEPYTLHRSISKCLKNLKPASAALESVSGFCKGDYLKCVESSLYSVCSNTNEDKLPSFLNELSSKAVSVRKHALHLTLGILDKEHIYNLLKKFMDTEKNASVRKFIFKSIFNFFVQNPNDYSWDMFKLNMKAVDVNDKEAIEILMQTVMIPRQYFIKYLLFTWTIIENAPNPQNDKEYNFSKLLNSIDSKEINLLPKEFCQKIIDTYFLKNVTGLTHFQSQVNAFVCSFIIHCDSEEEQDCRLNSNLEIVKNCAATKTDDYKRRAELWNYISDVLKEFCMQYLSDDCSNIRILKKFAELWKNSFPPSRAISEYLHLEFTLIYVEKLSLPEIGRKLAVFCDELTNDYGSIIIPIFLKKITFFYNYFLGEGDRCVEKLTVIENLLQADPSIACLILSIMLLDHENLVKEETKEQYERIIEILEKQTDQTVLIYYNNHIRPSTTLDYH